VKKVNVVTCEIREDDGRFYLRVEQTLESGKSVTSGFGAGFATQCEAVERGTDQIKKFLMPVQYEDLPLEIEMEEV